MIHPSSIHSLIDGSSSHLSCSQIILRCSGVICTLISWWIWGFVCHRSLNVHSQSNFQIHSFKMTTPGFILSYSVLIWTMKPWASIFMPSPSCLTTCKAAFPEHPGLCLSLDLDLGQSSGCWIKAELAIRGELSLLTLKSCCSAICVGPTAYLSESIIQYFCSIYLLETVILAIQHVKLKDIWRHCPHFKTYCI